MILMATNEVNMRQYYATIVAFLVVTTLIAAIVLMVRGIATTFSSGLQQQRRRLLIAIAVVIGLGLLTVGSELGALRYFSGGGSINGLIAGVGAEGMQELRPYSLRYATIVFLLPLACFEITAFAVCISANRRMSNSKKAEPAVAAIWASLYATSVGLIVVSLKWFADATSLFI